MINNYTYQTLPFYDFVEKQNFKKKWLYNDLCSSFLISPQNRLLPFQISRPTRYNTIEYVFLYNYDGTLIGDILADINATDIKIVSASGTDYITYYGNKNLANDLPCGLYYLAVYDNVQYWYSEVFKVDCFDYTQNKKITPTNNNVPSNDTIIVSNGNNLVFQ